jgi:hypothetical protein
MTPLAASTESYRLGSHVEFGLVHPAQVERHTFERRRVARVRVATAFNREHELLCPSLLDDCLYVCGRLGLQHKLGPCKAVEQVGRRDGTLVLLFSTFEHRISVLFEPPDGSAHCIKIKKKEGSEELKLTGA